MTRREMGVRALELSVASEFELHEYWFGLGNSSKRAQCYMKIRLIAILLCGGLLICGETVAENPDNRWAAKL